MVMHAACNALNTVPLHNDSRTLTPPCIVHKSSFWHVVVAKALFQGRWHPGMITVVCRFLTDDWSSLVMTPDNVLRDLDE